MRLATTPAANPQTHGNTSEDIATFVYLHVHLDIPSVAMEYAKSDEYGEHVKGKSFVGVCINFSFSLPFQTHPKSFQQ